MSRKARKGKSLPKQGVDGVRRPYTGWATEWEPKRRLNQQNNLRARTGPPGYEEKFANFIGMCDTLMGIVPYVTIPCPEMLGDNYEEIVESLGRIADAGFLLGVWDRSSAEPSSEESNAMRPDVLALLRGLPPSTISDSASDGDSAEADDE